jgi:toxin-antitoxin system, toxin component, Txe/YoeB family
MYRVRLHKQAVKDLERLKQANLSEKAKALKDILAENPFQPPYEKLIGDLAGTYSRRINIQHRMVYMVDEENQEVKILRMWTHYE